MARLKLKPYFAVIRAGRCVIHAMSGYSNMAVLSVLEQDDREATPPSATRPTHRVGATYAHHRKAVKTTIPTTIVSTMLRRQRNHSKPPSAASMS